MQLDLTSLNPGRPAPPRPPPPPGPYLVVGLGEAGQSAVRALRRLGAEAQIVAYDHRGAAVPRRVRREITGLGAVLAIEGDEALDEVRPRPRALVKSPGGGAGNPLVQQARQRGIPVLDELELGWRLSGAPMIAVTGTSGKTSTSALTTAVLKSAGVAATLAGNADIAPPLSALGDEPELIVCEVSSFQLESCQALMPEVGVFTNLDEAHLVRHGQMEHYFELKRSLFIRDGVAVRAAVIDTGDRFGRRLAAEVEEAGGRVLRSGFEPEADYRVDDASWDLRRSQVVLRTPSGSASFATRLPGRHNARNVAVVTAVSDLFGVDREVLAQVLRAYPGVPGRFEHLGPPSGPRVILDLCGAPAALEQVLLAIRGASGQGRLRAVLGELGGPEARQCRASGRIARRLSDSLVLTSGSYRPRPPLGTMELLAAGAAAEAGGELEVVPRREEAIARAIGEAAPEDVVVVFGRGNVVESVSDRKFDDRSVIRELVSRPSRHSAAGAI